MVKKDYSYKIPNNFDFNKVNGLSNELVAKLSEVQPQSLDQAARIEGMTPSAITLLLIRIKNYQKQPA